MSISVACASGMTSRRSAMSCVLRTPETTSSPWALTRKSPDGSGAPVTSSRLKATPVAGRPPVLPNTHRRRGGVAAAAVGLDVLDRALEPLARDPARDVAEHLHEAPVGVPGEALV